MDPGGGFGGAFGGGKAGGAQDPMTFVKRPAVIARICALVRDNECIISRPSSPSFCRFCALWLVAIVADTLSWAGGGEHGIFRGRNRGRVFLRRHM